MIDEKLKSCQILLVDDEQAELDAYSLLLTSMGFRNVRTVNDSRLVLATLESMQSPVVFLDLNMPHMTGQEVLRQLKVHKPQIPVIIITADSEIETAVECLRLGAHDYLVKPIDLKMFSSALRNALEIGLLRNEVMSLKGISFGGGEFSHPAFSKIVTRSPIMLGIFQYIESIAASGLPALILGETGSGKELIARAIHEVSNLPGEFVAVDISGLDDTLLSDTLFGHTKGAYTGADKSRSGLIEKAANGTLFLDEIGDLAEVSQVKLLRLLQEKIYYPLGADQPKQCHARIITAANKDLSKLAGQDGEFRMDLYYRLSTHLIRVPPLRDRREDIPLLVEHLIGEAATTMNKKVPAISNQALARLMRHPFWGNVRELKAYISDAVARCQHGHIDENLIGERLGGAIPMIAETEGAANPLESLFGHFPTIEELIEYAIESALVVTDNNQSQASRLLGVSRQALHKRIKKRHEG
ncbi:sigma-54-dependent transcriptional regulator [Desulfopila aestuarii]|uniref:DNA-binding transcriptional response regulator, NtrC family, contains REC, AAA-type ATPase, and a Fis-type DNA-binding domains n=1 Tax=Desulfopila aestuarii DSM 18488 TaxID=1121416 RepID=A0A1M7YCH4_9BACT|nr:sigma-54 dependent transcriptional regulator [Desulfopila aestuarii]SHO50340.1 DNA-binding transcriptional response regulator, NtrC family, contains REC, AAA-type ATPase, and a Fis-type DNA-binding domains [Desulfopila aestuarii DSM 18488]